MNKVSIIGTGSVGSTIAYTLTVMGLVSEIVMIDINSEKALGEATSDRALRSAEHVLFMPEITAMPSIPTS